MARSTVFHSCGKNCLSVLTDKLFPGGRHLPTVLHSLSTSFISALAYNVLFLEEVINQGRIHRLKFPLSKVHEGVLYGTREQSKYQKRVKDETRNHSALRMFRNKVFLTYDGYKEHGINVRRAHVISFRGYNHCVEYRSCANLQGKTPQGFYTALQLNRSPT